MTRFADGAHTVAEALESIGEPSRSVLVPLLIAHFAIVFDLRLRVCLLQSCRRLVSKSRLGHRHPGADRLAASLTFTNGAKSIERILATCVPGCCYVCLTYHNICTGTAGDGCWVIGFCS